MSSEPLTKKRLVTLVAGLFILVALSWYRLTHLPTDAPRGSTYLNGETMGTTYMVKVHGPGDTRGLQSELDDRLAEINALMSTYDPDSELSRFNGWQADVPFPLSPETYEVFDLALRISEQTEGSFDITVGPVVNAYGFGPTLDIDLPSDSELDAMREYVGYQHLRLEPGDHTITKDHAEVYCDLSAIAKGYAVDALAELIEQRGIENYFVEIGGEVRVRGVNDNDMLFWSVGIEKPVPDVRAIQSQIALLDQALATSGNYRNFSEVDGVQISHTIDPSTLKPVAHKLLSASVIHDDCANADAYATALMVMGLDEGLDFAERNDIRIMLLVSGSDGEIDTAYSSAWENDLWTVQDFVGGSIDREQGIEDTLE